MAINRFFDKTVSTRRLVRAGSGLRQTMEENLSSLECHIQPLDGEQNELLDGAYYQLSRLWCAMDTDIAFGDEVIDGSTTYEVRGVKVHDYGMNQHVSVSLAKAL